MRTIILLIAILACANAFLSIRDHPKGNPTAWFEAQKHKRSTGGYYLLNGCGVDPHLGLNSTQAFTACALLDFWITMHISNEGPTINRALFNATVASNMIYQFEIGYNAIGIESSWQLYSNVIAVQAQPAVNFSASEIYGIVDYYDPVAGTVNGRIPINVFAQLNFTQRWDVGLYGVCPNGIVGNIKYQVRVKMTQNKVSMEQVYVRLEEVAQTFGIDSHAYLNSLATYSASNTEWYNLWQDPASDVGVPSRPLSSPRCRHFDS